MSQIPFDPATHDSATAEFTLGRVYQTLFNGESAQFVYVKVVDQGLADGDVATYSKTSTSSNTVTSDKDNADWTPVPAGVAVGTITVNQHGFLMKRGIHDAVKDTGGSVAAEDVVIPDASNDGSAVTVTGGTNDRYALGMAFAASSGNTFPCMITL